MNSHILSSTIQKKTDIEYLRSLPYKSDEYERVKKGFPNITPHCTTIGGRRKVHAAAATGYLYYDIDVKERAGEPLMALKQRIIDEYGAYTCMCGISIGGQGLFFYVHVNGITLENFGEVHEYFKNEVFTTLKFDNGAKGIVRPQFITYDKNLWYRYNVIELPDIPEKYKIKRKGKNSINTTTKAHDIDCFSLISLSELLPTLIRETPVDTGNADFIIQPIDYVSLFVHKNIRDGRKHSTYRTYTNVLTYLNPHIILLELVSFMNYVNMHRTGGKPMPFTEMVNTVAHAWKQSKLEGLWDCRWVRRKRVHISKTKGFSKKEKIEIANRENGKLRRKDTEIKIKVAVEVLLENNQEVTLAPQRSNLSSS